MSYEDEMRLRNKASREWNKEKKAELNRQADQLKQERHSTDERNEQRNRYLRRTSGY